MSMYYNCCNAFCTMHSPPLSPFCVTYLNNFSSLNEIYLIYHSVIPCMFNILLYPNAAHVNAFVDNVHLNISYHTTIKQ